MLLRKEELKWRTRYPTTDPTNSNQVPVPQSGQHGPSAQSPVEEEPRQEIGCAKGLLVQEESRRLNTATRNCVIYV